MAFSQPGLGNSEEWDELACDVIEGVTMFAPEKDICEHAIVWFKNHCRMLGRYVAGGRSKTASLGESTPLYSIPLSQWHSSRSKKKVADLCEVWNLGNVWI